MKLKNVNCFIVENENVDKRVDAFLADQLKEYSRSYIKKLIKSKYVKVNNQFVKASYLLTQGDKIEIIIPDEKININPENISLDIIYEDDDVIIINKPQGMVVHPAPGNYSGTLVNALLYHKKPLSSINGEFRPGIVHRIDKDTSGLLIIAKNDFAHRKLAQQLQEHTITRRYIALTEKIIKKNKGTINLPIGRHPVHRKKMAVVKNGKPAITHFYVIDRFENNTLIEADLETGRTHQIRVHMDYIGHPLVGDPVYGYKKQIFSLQGQLLHAKKIGFIHPTKKIYMEFEAKLPEHFQKILDILRGK
ncbi:RluA family pseudouridine synthase [Garciella nitratireducens]